MSLLEQNYFQLFDLAASFAVDSAQLTARYRELQRLVHPDRYASGSEQDKRRAVQLAARINDAYRSLKDPLERAKYLLQLAHLDQGDEQENILDPAFLMQQMDRHEELAQAVASADATAALSRLEAEVHADQAQLVHGIGAAFAGEITDGGRQIRVLVKKLQFVRKLQEEIAAAEDRIFQ